MAGQAPRRSNSAPPVPATRGAHHADRHSGDHIAPAAAAARPGLPHAGASASASRPAEAGGADGTGRGRTDMDLTGHGPDTSSIRRLWPNVMVCRMPNLVSYEALFAYPAAVAQNLFDFTGLGWHPQPVEFIAPRYAAQRLIGSPCGFRGSGVVARQWRSTTHPSDQEAARTVVRDFPAARRLEKRRWEDPRN